MIHQNPTTRGLLLLLFISQNNLKCKIFASCPKNPTQKRKNVKVGKDIFLPSLLVFLWFDFSNQKSKVESLSGGNNRSWKSANEVSMKLQKLNSEFKSESAQQSTASSQKNCGFLTSVNQFSHLNIWIWEIEWGWSFFGTSSPENWKLKIQRRTFIHNFLSLKKVKHTHLECKAQDHFALEPHHPNEIVKWSDPELFWILIWYEINSNSQTFGQIFENSQFLLVILSPVQGANKQLFQ